MDAAEKLLAIEEIHQLKARYFRCVDTKDWEGYRAVFADNVAFDISDDMPDGVFDDADTAVNTARESLAGCTSVHHGHCPEIDITSPTTATGIWAMEDQLYWADDSAFPGQTLHGLGHYHEHYEKVDGRWVITSLKLRRLRVEFTPGADNGSR